MTFVQNIIKKLFKHYIKRFPDLMLLSFAFILSVTVTAASVAEKIIFNWNYYFLIFFLTLLIAIYDCVSTWFIERLDKP